MFQFEDFVLECVMYLLDQSLMNYRVRGDAVHIVRKLSALVSVCLNYGLARSGNENANMVFLLL